MLDLDDPATARLVSEDPSGSIGGRPGLLFIDEYERAAPAHRDRVIDEPLTLAHFRDRSGVEVDVLVERGDGSVVGFEVKSATSASARDAAGLRFLRDRLDGRFTAGIVLHTGPLTASLGDRLWALPIAGLWV